MKVIKFIDYDKISRTTINTIFDYANKYFNMDGDCNDCKGKVMCNAFFEPNYESELQFEIAMNKLGGKVIHHDIEKCNKSGIETFEDNVNLMARYCDIITLSHKSCSNVNNIFKKIHIPLIRTGNNKSLDEIQSIVDLYTLHKHFDIESERLDILFIGGIDNPYAQSFKKLLALYSNIRITHIEEIEMGDNKQNKVYNVIYDAVCDGELTSRKDWINKVIDKQTIIMRSHTHKGQYDIPNKKMCCVYSKQKTFGIYIRMSLIYTVLFNLLDNTYDTLEYSYSSQLQSEIHGW